MWRQAWHRGIARSPHPGGQLAVLDQIVKGALIFVADVGRHHVKRDGARRRVRQNGRRERAGAGQVVAQALGEAPAGVGEGAEQLQVVHVLDRYPVGRGHDDGQLFDGGNAGGVEAEGADHHQVRRFVGIPQRQVICEPLHHALVQILRQHERHVGQVLHDELVPVARWLDVLDLAHEHHELARTLRRRGDPRELGQAPLHDLVFALDGELFRDEEHRAERVALGGLVVGRLQEVLANDEPGALAGHCRRPAIQAGLFPQVVQGAAQRQLAAVGPHALGLGAGGHRRGPAPGLRKTEVELERGQARLDVLLDGSAGDLAEA